MRLYQVLKARKWLLLGILLPMLFGLMQDSWSSRTPQIVSPAYWRAFWMASMNKLQMSGLIGVLLLSLAAVTGGAIACIRLSRRNTVTANYTKVSRQGEVTPLQITR